MKKMMRPALALISAGCAMCAFARTVTELNTG